LNQRGRESDEPAKRPDGLCPEAFESGRTRSEAPEGALVRAVAGGDREALARLYDLHATRLITLVVRMLGDETQAEDIVHDVFVEAWHHADEFDPERGSVRAWLTTRARSRALDRASSRKRHERASDRVIAEARVETDSDLEGEVDAATLRGNLLGLPPELAQLIAGAYYEGLSAQTLADRFDLPVGTVKSRLARAIAVLRRRLIGPNHGDGGE
jgi:RNA polymerase sigma-70 factor (ECF subfamily)